jgi:pectate lyase
MNLRIILSIISTAITLCPSIPGRAGETVPAAPPAFPGAVGLGATATGGRGGTVCHVTTLADAGPGSLREAVSHSHRIVVFDIGGYIELKSILKIPGDITIAGQSAPGQGIGIRGHEVSFSGSKNIICRYLRIRQGLADKEAKKSAVALHDSHTVILDHLSIQWGRWDTVDMTAATDITIQHCIIGPGVAPQRFGCLCESDNVTFSHNLWIGNQSRNPKAKGKIQFINNVIYNWGKVGFVGGHSAADHYADLLGNYFIKGPSSSNSFTGEFTATDHVHHSGNMVDADLDGQLNGRPLTDADFPNATPASAPWSKSLPQVASAAEAYRIIVAEAGCSTHRDTVDTHLIADLVSLGKKGSVVSDPADMGGFGVIEGGTPPLDTDRDGIPDAWETAHGLNPRDPADAATLDKTGYSMLEIYLNSLVKSGFP